MHKAVIESYLKIKKILTLHITGLLAYLCLTSAVFILGACAPEIKSKTTGEDKTRPNVLIIIADDMGYSDIGVLGSEIKTPQLDELANTGILLTNFHAHSNCSPSRAMLFSGVDNHRSGLGTMQGYQTSNQKGQKGYEGYLNSDVVTFATLLKNSGYATFMTGKWHLGIADNLLPSKRGFEKTYVIGEGSADHFDPKQGTLSIIPVPNYRENGKTVTPPSEGFYSSKFFTDKMIAMLEGRNKREKPFLSVVSYTAPHWPIQAPENYIENYDGVYDEGYDVVRAARLLKQKKLGIIPADTVESEQNPVWAKWEGLNSDMKRREVRRMQTYAGMVEAMDHHLGRLLDYLKSSDEFDNTIIIFMSDNGPEGNNPIDLRDNPTWVPANFNLSTENIGKPGSYSYYGPGWAHVSATPFKLYKAFPTEGGIRVPAIISYPAGFKSGIVSSAFTSVLDIAPTILEMAKIDYPKTYPALDGTSMVSHLTGITDKVNEKGYSMGWELWDRKAIIQDGWKLVAINEPWGEGEEVWALYDLSSDLAENINLALEMPEKVAHMKQLWSKYTAANGVIKPEGLSLKFSNTLQYYD